MAFLKTLLEHPLTRGKDINDPVVSQLRRDLIQAKPFLRKIYEEWYVKILSELPNCQGKILELGSGGGFLTEFADAPLKKEIITSDVFALPNVKVACNGEKLPFRESSMRSIVMTNVFHHISCCDEFLNEAQRVLNTGGSLLLVEVWANIWAKLIFSKVHPEPFDDKTLNWSFPSSGPLSGANAALPWMVFVRDREKFQCKFPNLSVQTIVPHMPLSYLLSGGVSMRNLIPGFSFSFVRRLEKAFFDKYFGMFAFIVIKKI